MTEVTIPNTSKRWPVCGISIGQIVTGRHGRKMKVLRTDEWVGINDTITGPYCRLQAMDDKECEVIWPRDWFSPSGETMRLQFGEVV